LFAAGSAVMATADAGELLAYGWHPVGGLLLLAALTGETLRRAVIARPAAAGAAPAAPARAA